MKCIRRDPVYAPPLAEIAKRVRGRDAAIKTAYATGAYSYQQIGLTLYARRVSHEELDVISVGLLGSDCTGCTVYIRHVVRHRDVSLLECNDWTT